MSDSITKHFQQQLDEIRANGLFKAERVITTPQDAHIRVGDGQSVLNMCANNYLGLAEHPAVIAGRARRARSVGLRALVTCDSFAAPRPSTSSWKRRSASFWGPRTRFCTPRASTPMADCSRRC